MMAAEIVGGLAGFTSAIVLAVIAALIGYESVARLTRGARIRYCPDLKSSHARLNVRISSGV